MKRPNYAAPYFVIFLFSIVMVIALTGCSLIPKAQKGGRAEVSVSETNMVAIAQQPENPSGPATQSQEWEDETFFTLPAGSVLGTGRQTVPMATPAAAAVPTATKTAPPSSQPENVFTLSGPMPVRQISRRVSNASIGGAHKDEARSLAVRLQAMRPVQWTGIALCVGSIAAFYFGWATIGFLAIAVGGAMIVGAAILPGHETEILVIGGVGLAIAAVLVVYAWHHGKLHALEEHLLPMLPKAA